MIRILKSRPLPDAFEFLLDGGLCSLIRPITPADAPRFERGYLQLSEASRRMRFFGQASALSRTQLHFLTQLDQVGHAAWGALDIAQPDRPGIGVARYVRDANDRRTAEVAITVLDAYQHRGAGLLLHACLHLTAARHGIRRFVYDVSQDNARFLAHLKSIGAAQIDLREHIVRLQMPVYSRAAQVNKSPAGARFSEVLRRLSKVQPVAGA